jgi:predicted aldo/keto reductase-like oxidoreductase
VIICQQLHTCVNAVSGIYIRQISHILNLCLGITRFTKIQVRQKDANNNTNVQEYKSMQQDGEVC